MTWEQFLIDHAWKLAPLLMLLAGSAFFSGSETALFNLSRGELYRMRHGAGPGRVVARLMRGPRRTLNTLLLGNMLMNVAYTGIAAVTVLDLRAAGAAAWAVAVASLAPLLVLILMGEVGPKAVAFALGRRWAMIAAGPVAVLQRIFAPLLWFFEVFLVSPLTRLAAPTPTPKAHITEDELGGLLDLSAKRGVISRDANALLQEILELQDIRVSAIMVPRVDVIAWDIHAPRSGLLDLFGHTRLRRIPVYDGDLDHVLGVVHAKRVLLNPKTPLRDMLVPVIFLPEAANLERALLQLRMKGRQMAIVVDEYGGTAGLVTMEDLLEEIVGDIPDPDGIERGPAVEPIGEGAYLLDGDLAIHEWTEAFRIDLSDRRISTIGGFVMSLLGRVPAVGDEAAYRNLRFTVVSMRHRRIGKLRLQLVEDAE